MSEGYAAKDAAETTHTTNTSDSAKADEIEARDFTDIFRAAIKGSLSAVQHFLRLDPQSLHSTNAAGFTILHEAARHGHNDLAQLLLQKAASVNATTHTRETPLHTAAMKGYVALAEQLLAARACIDAKDDQGYDAYTFATINDQRPMKRLLRPVDAVINNCGDLAEAARDGNVEAAEHFVKVSPESINSKDIFGLTPLHDAAERGYPGVAKALLEARASIHDKTNTSRTPLHWAAENGHASVAKLLLEARAYTEAKNQWGLTPLHETARQGHAGVAQLLLPAGADVEAKDGWGRTALHWAPQLGHLSVAQLLLGHNADLKATDRECLTPLHFAAQSGRCDAVVMLLDQNADASVQDRAGDTPYDKAESNGHHKVMELLGSVHVALPSVPSRRRRATIFPEVFVSLLSGRTCRCIYHNKKLIKELKEEAEQKLGVTIQHLIGSSMEPLTESERLEEANILPDSTVTAIIAAAQPPVMFALYETHEKDVYEKMLAVEQSLMRSGVNAILHDKRKTQSELNKDFERLKSKKGVLLHVASAGFTENTDLESCHELKFALDNNIETLCLSTEEQYSPEHRKDTKKGESAGPVENMLAAADVVNCVGLTAEEIATQLEKHVTAPKKGQAERTIAGNTKKEAQEKEGVISSLEKDCKEMKAEVEVLSTKLLDSQQAADNHNEGAKELQLRISTLEEELASARREGESLQGAEADLKSTLAQKEFALLDALASSEARRANEAALRSALQNQEKLLADERVAKAVAERHLAERVAQMVDLQEEIAEMLDLQSQLGSSEVALNAKLEETAHSESSLREKLQAEQLRKRIPRSNSEGPESLHWPAEARRASCTQAVRQNLSQGSSGSDGIPEAYLRVMQQIDQIGWDNMCWGRGFTLLHWAAKHDRADLCELFLWHGADPGHRDDSNRSALDYARLRQPQALAALEVLQKGKPMQKPVVQLPTACESEPHRELPLHLHESQKELHSFVAYEQDGVLLEMAESIELQYKPRLEISKKLDDKIVSMLPDGVGLLSPIVSLTPEGEKFNPPIRCIFPACNGATKAFRATAGRLEELEEAIFRGGYCEVSLDHFSCVLAGGSPLPLVARGYLKSESNRGKIGLSTLNCEHCEKIVKNQEDFEEGVNSFRACGEPVVLGLTSLNESVKLLHDKTELKIEQVDPTCPRLPPFVSTDFLIGGPEPESGAFTIQVERDSTVTYKHLFQFSFPTMHAEPQASSSTGPNQMVPSVLGMPQRTHLMLSGRFSTPEKCEYMKSLKGVLEGKGVHCYLVEAGPGDEFGFQTMEGLACAKAMLAVCCEEYGAYTGAGYETYYEVRYAWDNRLPIIPLRLCEVYPPQPDRAGAIQNGFVFHKSLVRIEGRGRSIQEVAVDIEKAWKRMAKLTRVSL